MFNDKEKVFAMNGLSPPGLGSYDNSQQSPRKIYRQEFYLYYPVLRSTQYRTPPRVSQVFSSPNRPDSSQVFRSRNQVSSYSGSFLAPWKKLVLPSVGLIVLLAVLVFITIPVSDSQLHRLFRAPNPVSLGYSQKKFDFATFDCTNIPMQDFQDAGLTPMVYDPRFSTMCLYIPATPNLMSYSLKITKEFISLAEWSSGPFFKIMCIGKCSFSYPTINNHHAVIIKQSFPANSPWECYLYVSVDASHGISFSLVQQGVAFQDDQLQKLAQKLIT